MKHPFITVEGIDGAGKSTVVLILAERLGASIIKTPHERFNDERAIIERQGTPSEKYEFYLKALKAHQDEIASKLKDRPVVCDRYIHSTIAYQWPYNTSIPNNIRDSFPSLIRPDCAVLLTVSRRVSRERIARRESQTGIVSPTDHNVDLLEKARRRFLSMYDLTQINTDHRTPEQVCDLILIGLSNESA